MLNIENTQDSFVIREELLRKLNEALDRVCEGEGVLYEPEVSVYFVDDPTIAEYNATYRSIPAATDVLSFPGLLYPPGMTFQSVYNEDNLLDHMFNEDRLMLGDVVISGDRVESQALEYGHSTLREAVFLFVHSILHLLGYDHMEDADKQIMNAKEDFYMSSLGVER